MKEQPSEDEIILPEDLFINLSNTELQNIIALATKDDTLAKQMVQDLQTNTNTNWTLSTLDNQDNFVLFHNGSMYIPDDLELRCRIVSQFHNGPISGHPGILKTTTQVQREYYWPGMRSFILMNAEYANNSSIFEE